MATGFTDIGLHQETPYTLPNAKVMVTFNLTGQAPDIVQVYAQEAGSQPANIVEATLVGSIDWQTPNPEGNTLIELQAGNAFDIWLCPRNETDGTLDDDYDNEYWEISCTYAGPITTQVPQAPTQQPTKPVIIKIDNEPATLKGDGSITVSWVSSPYDKFLITWTYEGAPPGGTFPQGEVDGSTSSWTATPTTPGFTFTFAVEGGISAGLAAGYNWSGWGPTVAVKAVPNLRSLVAFLNHSGINPAGLSVKSIMGGQTSLKKVMKLT
jgi:hypothetical protein